MLGDNGAGKSTLIKIISGLHPHTSGTLKVDGKEVRFGSPRDSLDRGIATVYQDLAVVSLMEVWRNFFDAGLGVVFITHNPHHAFMVGNHFIILKLGRRVLDKTREEVTLEELTSEMAGGRELAELSHELQGR